MVERTAVLGHVEAVIHGCLQVPCDVVIVHPIDMEEGRGVPWLEGLTEEGTEVCRAYFREDADLYILDHGSAQELRPGRTPVVSGSDRGVMVCDGATTVEVLRSFSVSNCVVVHELRGEVTWRKVKNRMRWIPGQMRL